jgi:hypothetical protein
MTPSAGEQFLEDVLKPVVDVSDISKKIRLALHRPGAVSVENDITIR